jgi:ribosome biogenesis protein ENP2
MSLQAPTEAFNGVKVYNLASVGKALPAWVLSKGKKAQAKKAKRKWTERETERIEVLQDLFFPTSSARVKVSRDGGTLMATGGYPPQVRAYELRELSLKFSRHFESEARRQAASTAPPFALCLSSRQHSLC